MKRLRIPVALGFAVIGATSLTTVIGSCHGSDPVRDAHVFMDADGDAHGCELFCIPNGTDAGVCPEPAQCVDAGSVCPPGCQPVG